jgi:hypothetical protein
MPQRRMARRMAARGIRSGISWWRINEKKRKARNKWRSIGMQRRHGGNGAASAALASGGSKRRGAGAGGRKHRRKQSAVKAEMAKAKKA